ncbi:DUF106 domain-containing protein [Candidatus Micrarchaeota archaeon]|nr:DUF106 domain-containing protein [Candidatus Micrarchaeota archaeon]
MVEALHVVLVLAVAYSLFSLLLQFTLGNRVRVKGIQKEMADLQKKIQKASESKDEKEVKKLQETQSHMTGLMFESMKYQFKPLLVVLPVFIALFGGFGFNGFLMDWYSGFRIVLPFDLHLPALFSFNILTDGVYGVRGFFLVGVLFSGLLIQLVLSPLIERFFNKQP